MTGVDDLEAAVREAVAEIAGAVEGTVGIVVPVARRVGGQRLAGVLAGVRRRRAGARAAVDSAVTPSARTGSWCSPASTPRAWSSTASSSSRPQEIEAESATGRATLYVVLTRATQRMVTVTT